MTEYIERDALKVAFCRRCNEEMTEEPCEPADCFALEVIMAIPAADVAPVRHGRWMYCREDGVATCSECSNTEVISDCGRFCGYCGAKMDGGANYD